jgi:FHA domain
MTEGREEAVRRPARAPLRQRTRRRWAIAGGLAAFWMILEVVTGSAVSATVLVVAIGGLGAASVAGLRVCGVTKDHPWIRQLASRPWREGQDVLKVAIRHLSDVFVVTPSGSLLAPNVVELQLNPDDLVALCEQMELGVINASVTQVYEEQAASYGAAFAGPGRPAVHVIASGSVAPGRYRLRQGDPVGVDGQLAGPDVHFADAAPEFAYAGLQDAYAESTRSVWQDPDARLTIGSGMATCLERSLDPVPVLRLITGSSVAETLVSGARAGRGPVELVLPNVPTVSREHAEFTFCDGRWWVTNRGRNGLTLNGAPVEGRQPLSDGDAIRWGKRPDALLSRVEIS